jgi:predicted dehydrogenase
VDRVTLVGRNSAAVAERAAEFPIVRHTASEPRTLWEDPSVDVVQVVVPHHLHAECAVAALAAGKHVICEKPAGTSLSEFDRIAATARDHDRRLLVVMNHLYNPITARVRELVDEGVLGRVFLSVENAYSDASRNYRDPHAWRTRVDSAGGGLLIDGGYHMVYRHLYHLLGIGLPRWVTADVAQVAVRPDGRVDPDRGEDLISVTVGYEGPLRIQWSHGWTLASQPRHARQHFLAGTEATLEWSARAETPLWLHRGDASHPVSVETAGVSNSQTTQLCLLDYLDCIFTDRIPEHASLDLARSTLAVVMAAYESGRQKQRVDLETPNHQ